MTSARPERRTPTQVRARMSHDAVLEATRRLLEESTEGGLPSTNRIARRAGVSVGTLYQYFDNREAILRALVREHSQEMSALVASHAGPLGLSAPRDDSGYVVVFLGSAAGPSTSTFSSSLQESYGTAVSAAGDVDGDGYDDVLAYAQHRSDDDNFTGRVYVLPGSAAGTLTSASATVEGEADDHLGSHLSALGDVDGDGYADVGLGADVYTGSSTGLVTVPAVTVDGDVYAAGDINGDGYSDVIAGDASYDHGFGADRAGAAWTYLGAATAPLGASARLVQAGDGLGTSVASVDLNGDGFDDLVVGAWRYDGFRGEALVYLGSAAGLSTTATATLVGDAPGDCFGYSVAAAGDTDGDGYDDLVVGAFGAGDYGALYTYFGTSAGIATTATSTISGDSSASYVGYRVAGVGDVNGDGYDDLAATTYPGTNQLLVYPGSPSGPTTTEASRLDLSCSPGAVVGALDVNGDGYDDLAVGCEDADSNVGAVYIFEGSASGSGGSAATALHGESVDGLFGHAIGSGDIDGDGYADVVVGAPGTSGGAGSVSAFHGASIGLSTTAGAVLGGASTDALGAWLSGVGDSDGDGFDDVLVAAPGAESVFLQLGSASGLSATPTISASGYESLGDILAAGDFNGDSLVDVARGDPERDADAGQVSAWYGCVDEDEDGACASVDCDDLDPAVIVLFYVDADGDGYGDPALPTTVCTPEPGYATDATDCDDTSAGTNPGMAEICDDANTDEDCDGVADDQDPSATGEMPLYLDEDGDGYGGGALLWVCDGVAEFGDCDDADPDVHVLFFADADGDGYGDRDVHTLVCVPTPGYSDNGTDCDDTSAAVNPGMEEVCDDGNTDEDCNGRADDKDPYATGQTMSYEDADRDGYGADVVVWLCDGVYSSTDCDDTDAAVHPEVVEVCDGVDNDCSGEADDPSCHSGDAVGTGGTCGCATAAPGVPAISFGAGIPWVALGRRRRW